MRRKFFACLTFLLISAAASAQPTIVASTAKWQTIEGKPFVVDKTKDRQLVLFWGMWCTKCKGKLESELPTLAKKHPDLEVVAMALDPKMDKVKRFVADKKISVPVVADPDRSLQKKLRIYAVPSWAVMKRVSETSWEVTESGTSWSDSDVALALRTPKQAKI